MTETEKIIKEVKIALSRITQGKWVSKQREFAGGSCAIYLGEFDFDGFDHHKDENAEFIANAPTWLMSLITAIETMQTDVIFNQKEEIAAWERSEETLKHAFHVRDGITKKQLYDKDEEIKRLQDITKIAVKALEYVKSFPYLESNDDNRTIQRHCNNAIAEIKNISK